MQPIFGFILFFIACLIVAVVASKRGRSGILFFLGCGAAGFLLAVLIGNGGGTGLGAGFGAFVAPALGLMIALSSKNSAQIAVEHGAHGDYKKCPFCAEPVRREAIKCKHCGSTLDAATASATTPQAPADELSESEAMSTYGITLVNGMFVYEGYRYDKLEDALNYAKRQPAGGIPPNSSSKQASPRGVA